MLNTNSDELRARRTAERRFLDASTSSLQSFADHSNSELWEKFKPIKVNILL